MTLSPTFNFNCHFHFDIHYYYYSELSICQHFTIVIIFYVIIEFLCHYYDLLFVLLWLIMIYVAGVGVHTCHISSIYCVYSHILVMFVHILFTI